VRRREERGEERLLRGEWRGSIKRKTSKNGKKGI